MTELLQGKVAVVTGGASGIGRAIVTAFVAHGAQVAFGDIDDERGRALAVELGDAVDYQHADVTDDEQLAALVDGAWTRFGRFDVMVNNAGASGDRSPVADADVAGFDATTELLLRSVLLGHKYAARHLIDQGTGGSIISIGSIAGLEGGWGGAAYTTAKHGVTGLVRAGAAQLGRYGIRCNAIHPGLVMTPIYVGNMRIPPERGEEFLTDLGDSLKDQQPLGRTGRPEDVGNAAVFLASDLAGWITGVQLPVDGGYNAVTNVDFGGLARSAQERFWAR